MTIMECQSASQVQLVTFRCGNLTIGLDLASVQEIKRRSDITDVPEAPPEVCGVINLRGEVITMIDLRVVLKQSMDTPATHSVYVLSGDEVIGLVTDAVSDIVAISEEDIDATPSNIRDADSTMFRGVFTTEDNELVVILDLKEVLDHGTKNDSLNSGG